MVLGGCPWTHLGTVLILRIVLTVRMLKRFEKISRAGDFYPGLLRVLAKAFYMLE